MDLLEQCELDDEKLMGKSSRHRGPKVGEGEREVGRHRNQKRGGKLRATWGPQKKCKELCWRERKRGRDGTGRQTHDQSSRP